MLSPRGTAKSILIIDDDIDIRDLLTQIFVCEGYQVHTAANGWDGLRFLRNAKELPALILLDLKMPRMNGFQFIEKLKLYPDLTSIPVVVISGDNRNKQKEATLGAAAYLTKPIDFDLLLDTACLITSSVDV